MAKSSLDLEYFELYKCFVILELSHYVPLSLSVSSRYVPLSLSVLSRYVSLSLSIG
jgi:hypothetical protein